MSHPLLSDPEVRFQIDALAAWLAAQVAYRELPGLAIGLVYDQDLIWQQGFGVADRAQQTPVTAQSVFRIASITKLFTSTAILHLRDAGKLQLDDPVVRHLPWFNLQNEHADGPPITIRALLTHTAGIPREAGAPYWNDFSFPSRAQMQATLPNQRTVFPVGQEWKYSNLGATLAGEIVATVAGEPYVDYVQRVILDPLEMHQTYLLPQPETPNLATGYSRRLPGALERTVSPFTDCAGMVPAANMASCVEDLAKFAAYQFRRGPAGGKQILSGHTLAEMQRIHWLEADWEGGWGLGCRITRQFGKTLVGHGGALHGYRTQIQLCPADKFGVIVLTNADDGEPLYYVDRVMARVAPVVVKAATVAAAPAPVAGIARYVGRYRNAWGDLEILEHAGQLVGLYSGYVDPWDNLLTLTPVGEHSFRLQEKDGFGANGELAVFEFDATGKVARLRTGDTYIFPVERW